jgi:methylphosphotriester-DNA--protein-cysteine methyltransferase
MDSKKIFDHFGNLPDAREDTRRHLLVDILVIIVCSPICGAEKRANIEAFEQAKEAWLRRY